MVRQAGNYALTDADRSMISAGLEHFLYKTVTRKSFRKWSITRETEEHVRRALAFHIQGNTPLHFTFPFGAYKRWNLPSAPRCDWAEVFALAYYASYLAPVAAAYPPGCILTFMGDDVIVPRLNNIPTDEVQQWSETFKKILLTFAQYLPGNMKIELRHVRDLYTPEEFERELEAAYPRGKAEWDTWDENTRQEHLVSSRHNIRWQGIEDWSGLSDKEKEEKVLESAILHNVYRQLPERRAYTRGVDKICIFSRKISRAIPLGSTKSSSVYFWVGVGVLEKKNGRFTERIFSSDQYNRITTQIHYEPVDIAGIELKTVPVLE